MYRILIITLSILFISCKDKVAEFPNSGIYFNCTQPENVSEINRIPKEYLGLYVSSDSVFIRVLKNSIVEESLYKFKVHKSQLDSLQEEFVIFKDKLISKVSKDTFRIKTLKDSILLANKRIDTFFIFSKNKRLIKTGKHLVVNTKDSIFWRVKILTLEKKSLFINYVGRNEFEVERFDSITKIKSKMLSDSSGYIVQPTKKEFKNYLKKNSSKAVVKFNRINN